MADKCNLTEVKLKQTKFVSVKQTCNVVTGSPIISVAFIPTSQKPPPLSATNPRR